MKRLIFTLSLSFLLISFSSFAGKTNETISPLVLKSFETSFKTATEVSWQVSDNYYKAQFGMNGTHIIAYYDCDAKLIAMTRNISSVNLPISLQVSLRSDFENLWITELVEVASEEGTVYYLTLEDADNKVQLKSSYGAEWNILKRQKKS